MTQWLCPPRSALPLYNPTAQPQSLQSIFIHLPHPGKSGHLGFSHCLIETLTRGHVIELTWGQAVKRPRRKSGNGGMKASRCSATARCIYRPSDTSEELGSNLGAFSRVCRSVSPCRNVAECECLVASLAPSANMQFVQLRSRRCDDASRPVARKSAVCMFAILAK